MSASAYRWPAAPAHRCRSCGDPAAWQARRIIMATGAVDALCGPCLLAPITGPIIDRHLGIDPDAEGATAVPILSGDAREALIGDLIDALRPHGDRLTPDLADALTEINGHEEAEAVLRLLDR